MTGGSATEAAGQTARTAVIAALAPICATQFRDQADAAGKLAELKALGSYERSDFIVKGGWATMPGSEAPVNGVAYSCVDILTTAEAADETAARIWEPAFFAGSVRPLWGARRKAATGRAV